MKLKNKLLFILLFFILVFIISDSKSYAYVVDKSDYTNCAVLGNYQIYFTPTSSFHNTDSNNFTYLYYQQKGSSRGKLFVVDSPVDFVFKPYSDNGGNVGLIFGFKSDSSYGGYSYYVDTDDNGILHGIECGSIGDWVKLPGEDDFCIDLLASNCNVYNENNDLVFQPPLEMMGLVPVEVVKPVQVQATMKEILPVLVPLGVGILAVLIVVPMIIKKMSHF